jgi:hypothetical protein
MSTLSRRSFLAASAGAVTLAACGSSGSSNGAKAGTKLVQFFGDGYVAPGAQRLPMGLGDAKGVLTTGGPDTITFKILDPTRTDLLPGVVVKRHEKDLPRPYWPLQLTLDKPGVYTAVATSVKGNPEVQFSVTAPGDILIPKVGDKLPPFDTPTTDNSRQVNPICTRNPVCPLHTQTLTQALATGKPVAFLIATPAHCKTAVCGPVLDLLVGQQAAFGSKVEMVHAEVYTDDSINTVAPVVDAYKMDFEPSLYLADASGKIVNRIDNVWDTDELVAALTKLTS